MIPAYTIKALESKDIKTDIEAQKELANLFNNHLLNAFAVLPDNIDLDEEVLKKVLQDNIIPLAKMADYYYSKIELIEEP
jgi:hypothetical protein